MRAGVTHEERGRGPALVFLHGVGGDAACWHPQLDAFGGRFRAVAWNMPGYGGSAPLPETTFPTLAAALLALLDRLGIERAHLVGHSMGGMVALEVAATSPERLLSLALIASSAAFGRPDGDWQRSFLDSRLGPLDHGRSMADLAPEIVAGMVGEAPDPAGVARAVRSMSAVPARTYRGALQCLLTFDRRAALPSLSVPTLLVAGERDRVAPPALMQRMAACVVGAHCITLARAGHLVNLEQPATFNRALAGFLTANVDL